jgi:superfamily II helicase
MLNSLRDFLEASDEELCQHCQSRQSYGADTSHAFGGVELCKKCNEEWAAYVESFPDRFAKVFPEIKSVISVRADSSVEK